MGHSSRNSGFANNNKFRVNKNGDMLDHESSLGEFKDAINNKQAKKVARIVAPHMISMMPDGTAKTPMYYAVSMGYDLMKNKDLKGTIGDESASFVADKSWDMVEDKLAQESFDSSLKKVTEEAYKETINTVIIKGVESL